ncbi:MAG: bifunctional oligoribonuclease/PAP phosphatase NrnA [Nitrospiraceae bacterium]|nr:bifunctional oligoribonuclease/PAP phosphatase NrnA [Nitrospiraceae bacterium]
MKKNGKGREMSELERIISALEPCTTVLLSVHKNPDGDALGAQLALLRVLERSGKRVFAHNLDPVPEIYRFLPGQERITSGPKVAGSYDALVVLDADPPRTGLFDGSYPARTLINIDHHITNPRIWPLTWLEPEATATGEMVYHLIARLGLPIDRETALCLYTSVFTDTGSFRYSNTTPESMRISASLIEAGADPWMVTEHVYESYSFKRVKLLGLVLGGVERSSDGRTAWVVVTDELFRQTGTTAEDTDNFVNFVRSIKGVEVAVLFRQTAMEQYKISLRSKGRVDLSQLAQSFGGGGHKNAAGGVMDGTFAAVRDKVIAAVERQIAVQLGAQSRS